MPEGRTFTEAEHQAILQGAVEREVAAATETRDATISTLEQRVDVLEAEKAGVVQEKDTLQSEFDTYKAEVETAREVAARKAERLERVKAAAIHLPEDYFSDERMQRWAEMADEQFATLVEDFQAMSLAGLTTEEAKLLEGLEGDAKVSKLAEIRAARQEKAAQAGAGGGQRETAAFAGGVAPTSPEVGSKVGAFLSTRRSRTVAAAQE